jgi:hypothetical protein
MFRKLKTFMGLLLYWIAAGIAILMLAQACFLAISANALVAILLGCAALVFWFIALLLRNSLVRHRG